MDSPPPLPQRMVQIDFTDMPPDLPPKASAKELRRDKCMAIRKSLVKKVSYTIDAISMKIKDHNIELTLSNIVVLSLHLPIFIAAHQDIGKDMDIAIDYIPDTYSFYVVFPLMDESILIEATRDESIQCFSVI
jgi:hypothetical protein